MKKSYIKITALICVLIMVAIALGGILFTIVQVNEANSRFNKQISSMEDTPQLSDMTVDSSDNLEATLVVFNGLKYLTNRTDPDIGHYGRYIYNDSFWQNNMDPSGAVRFQFILDGDTQVEEYEYIEQGDEEGLPVEVHLAGDLEEVTELDSSMSIYLQVSSSNTNSWTISTAYAEDEDYEGFGRSDEENKQLQLNREAMEIYEKLIEEYKFSDSASVFENGWLTSYAFNIKTESLYLPMVYDPLKVYMYDTYVYHPLEAVLRNYAYAYILFVVLLIVLWLITCFAMRRMYINRMNYEARAKNLTRSFAHELKTPLAVTQAYVENWEFVSENERAGVAAKINEEIEHMNKMVNTLLNLSKMDSGDVKLDLEEVELFEMAEACSKHMKAIADDRNIDVSFTKDDENSEYVVMADLDMMNMAISNFLSNAIKYGKKKVEVSLQSSGRNIIFKITNDGETISAKDQKKIWDLFYKKDKSGTDRMGSTGVGLSVNKSILDLHKAKFGVYSGSGETTFWFEMKKAKE